MRTIWDEIRRQFQTELPKNSFSLWINPITFLSENDRTIILGCPNRFSKGWITDHYLKLIREKFEKAGAGAYELVLKVSPQDKPPPPSMLPEPKQLVLPNIPTVSKNGKICLNADFTFERFVVGKSNQFAYSATKALAQGEPLHYHSLLMLAKTGLGKSHLSQAVGNTILSQNPKTRVRYITAEDFANEMIYSLKNNRIEEFKDRYRRCCDVLLLEEVHFLNGKEKTQLELGYTLDVLANENKKIIFTSAIPPQELPSMSKQLSSRLTSGLVMNIEQPDLDTRVQILTRKASEHHLPLSEAIIQYLASHLLRDVRQLESAVRCLKAKSELLNEKIDLNLAKDVVSILVASESSVSSEDIVKLVCQYYKIDPEMLRSRSRKKVYAFPRNVYVYLSRKHTNETLESIASSIDRSHSTVLYTLEVTEQKIKTDPEVRRQVDFLSQKLLGSRK